MHVPYVIPTWFRANVNGGMVGPHVSQQKHHLNVGPMRPACCVVDVTSLARARTNTGTKLKGKVARKDHMCDVHSRDEGHEATGVAFAAQDTSKDHMCNIL